MVRDDLFDSFRSTLISGGYNLLLGSGVCLDSCNGLGQLLRGAEKLRQDLCARKAVGTNTTLARVSALLSDDERRQELVDGFSKCKPGHSLRYLPNFLWRRLFTFNIDDVLENLYGSRTDAKQSLIPLNYDAPFEPTPERQELPAIHLHGWVGQPDKPFVFSMAEYVRVIGTINPWMHLLSEVLATESFILSGTSLNEFDLEYYLSHRSDKTPRRGHGPSFLIDPYPDAATEADCTRFGLTLIKATFGDFLEWLHAKFPAPPSVADLIVPDISKLFPNPGLAPRLIRFFTDFRAVFAGDQPKAKVPTPFLFGREPQASDLDQHLDIPRADNDSTQTALEGLLATPDRERLIAVVDGPGTGKTTTVQRVVHDLVRKGIPVVAVHTLSRIDPKNAIECFSSASTTVVIAVDSLADHAEQLLELLDHPVVGKRIIVIGSERSYRKPFVDLVLGDVPQITRVLTPLTGTERRQLIELYDQFGLVGNHEAKRNPALFASRLKDDPIAIAVCRILNDFRPLDSIVDSLWQATDECFRIAYLAIALSQHCHVAGIRYSIIQKMMGPKISLGRLFEADAPLGITPNTEDDYYVLPLNSVIGERVLQRAIHKDRDVLFEAFRLVATGLSPHVNRRAIMARSPEARLAQRLFDCDKIVKPLLGGSAGEFYIAVQQEWKWNSRYWEQRALLAAGNNDLTIALQYARHAVAVELHPFPLTTLGKILLQHMDYDKSNRDTIFAEAFNKLINAIQIEGKRSRIRVHPFSTLFSGTARYLELGGKLNATQERALAMQIQDAEEFFSKDAVLQSALVRLRSARGF